LRKAVAQFLKDYERLDYTADEILISGGARPLIYAYYVTLLDAGDKVIVPTPSWNNNHYCHLTAQNRFTLRQNMKTILCRLPLKSGLT
jgi:aspartate aminotransferase